MLTINGKILKETMKIKLSFVFQNFTVEIFYHKKNYSERQLSNFTATKEQMTRKIDDSEV